MTAASVLCEGFYFGEGPRWHDGKLWVSDFFAYGVKTVTAAGAVETMVEVPGRPSGLGWLPDGRLLVVSMTDRRVLRLEAEGLVEHADLAHIATFHCNDMVVDARGRAYVGNFGFDLDRELAERGPEAVWAEHATATLARVDPDGSVHAVAHDLHFPNGMVITSDGGTLIVAETAANRLTAFTIGANGDLSDRRVWADTGHRAPDGICLDANGNVWMANPLAPECVLVAEGGEVLAVVETSLRCFACMLGGDTRTTLFMTTAAESDAERASLTPTGRIETCEVATPGAGRP